MILPTNLANAVAAGRKTTHRLTRCSWRPGRRIAILADAREPGTDPLCHVEIADVELTTLWALSREQAAAEGFGGVRGPLNFKRYWLNAHDRAWVATHTGDGLTDEHVADRFASTTRARRSRSCRGA